MKKILRSAVLVAGIATSVAMGMTSAHAAGGGAFTGTASIERFGVGASRGTASLSIVSTAGNGPVTATYTVFEDPSTCPVTGTASGTFAGTVSGGFTWTRVGATAVISITGGQFDGGTGTAVFVVTSPVGNPCGQPVTATVAGTIVDPS